MSPQPTIRPLEPDEIDVYRRIRWEALTTDPDAFGETIGGFETRTDEGLGKWLGTHAGRPDRGILLAELDGRPVAMCGFGRRDHDPDEGFVWGVFVSPGSRRRGVARELLARVQSALEEAGVTRITARVAAPNEGALEFYRAQGFTVGERTGTLREGSDVPVYEIEMRLEREGPEGPGSARRSRGRRSTLLCPSCGTASEEVMPEDACVFFWTCPACAVRHSPKEGDCCVFCSYGTVPCPPVQASGS